MVAQRRRSSIELESLLAHAPNSARRRDLAKRILVVSWDVTTVAPEAAHLEKFFGLFDFVLATRVAGGRALVLLASAERAARAEASARRSQNQSFAARISLRRIAATPRPRRR